MSNSAASEPSRRFGIHLSEWHLFRSIESSFVTFLQSESLQASVEVKNTKQVTPNHCSSSPNTPTASRVVEFIKRNDKRTVSWTFLHEFKSRSRTLLKFYSATEVWEWIIIWRDVGIVAIDMSAPNGGKPKTKIIFATLFMLTLLLATLLLKIFAMIQAAKSRTILFQ